MRGVKLVLVGIEGSVNLGFILRLAKNFSVDTIILVNPREIDYETVERYSAKARDLIRHLKVVSDLEKAFSPGELRVCTSAKSSSDDPLRQPMTPRELAETFASGGPPLALVFGRESTGLTREELSKCHTLVTIEANPEYPVLNLSHAVAIILYELYTAPHGERGRRPLASTRTLESLEESYGRLVDLLVGDEQKKTRLKTAFRRMVYRCPPTPLEARSLAFTLRRAVRRLEERGVSGTGASSEDEPGHRGPGS